QRPLNAFNRPRGRFQRQPQRSQRQSTMNPPILNIGRRRQRNRPLSNINPSINIFTAIQQYTDLAEGSNPFIDLQNARIPSQNAQYQDVLFL
ncbi:6492_t:CDS:1, partial [Racocetra fulgida]